MSARNLTVLEIREGLQTRRFSSREITAEFLDAIKSDEHNIYLSTNGAVLEQAEAADARLADGTAGPLTGVPFAVKDVLVTGGVETTAASRMLKGYLPPYTATAVSRLEDAGMVLLGKTNCDEFAAGSSNENSAYGRVLNPLDSSRVPGGSSGGSAAAVAGRLAPVALGTDTGGSVRLPAAFCGVIGFKPTYGRVSRYGLIAMASSLDHVGILSHTPGDAALLLSAMAGHDPHDATSSPETVEDYTARLAALSATAGVLRIGLPAEYFAEHADKELGEVLESTIAQYRETPGVELVDITLPHTQHALAVYYIIMSSEFSSNLARYDGLRYGTRLTAAPTLEAAYATVRGSGFGEEIKRRVMLGTYSLSAGYYEEFYAQAARVRTLIARDFEHAFRSVDLIMVPTSPTPAFALGEKITDPLTMYLSDIYTVSANLAGIPAVSYPVGLVRGLPVGMQLMGPHFSEGPLFAACDRLMKVARSGVTV